MYLEAIIDVQSRKVLNWSISNSMTAEQYVESLEGTIQKHGTPEIHNSDQGSQYTSDVYINKLKKNKIKISMDGKGRALDNIKQNDFGALLNKRKSILTHQMEAQIYIKKLRSIFHFTTQKEGIQKQEKYHQMKFTIKRQWHAK